MAGVNPFVRPNTGEDDDSGGDEDAVEGGHGEENEDEEMHYGCVESWACNLLFKQLLAYTHGGS